MTSEQEKESDLIRKAWGLAKPRYNRLPRWFRLKMPDCVIPHEIYDHFGIVEDELHGEVAVFEPYEISCDTKEAREIAKAIANKIGCGFSVSIRSYWLPGFTIRISFYENKKKVPQ